MQIRCRTQQSYKEKWQKENNATEHAHRLLLLIRNETLFMIADYPNLSKEIFLVRWNLNRRGTTPEIKRR
jgi:hypothetical protein